MHIPVVGIGWYLYSWVPGITHVLYPSKLNNHLKDNIVIYYSCKGLFQSNPFTREAKSPLANGFVNKSAKLPLLPSLKGVIVLVTTFSLTKWKHKAMFFFLRGDSGHDTLWITLELSPFLWHRLFSGIPNDLYDLYMYHIVIAYSVANFIAENSVPYVEVATASCLLWFPSYWSASNHGNYSWNWSPCHLLVGMITIKEDRNW